MTTHELKKFQILFWLCKSLAVQKFAVSYIAEILNLQKVVEM